MLINYDKLQSALRKRKRRPTDICHYIIIGTDTYLFCVVCHSVPLIYPPAMLFSADNTYHFHIILFLAFLSPSQHRFCCYFYHYDFTVMQPNITENHYRWYQLKLPFNYQYLQLMHFVSHRLQAFNFVRKHGILLPLNFNTVLVLHSFGIACLADIVYPRF